jgi:cytochrome c oxidase subunit 2
MPARSIDFTRRVWRRLAAFVALALLAACADNYPQTTFKPVTEYGRKLNALFANTFIWTMIVLAVVVLMMLYIIIRYREKPDTPMPKPIHGSTLLEIGWTIGPAIIVAFIAIPTVRGIFETQADAPAGALTVEVVAHQWWWEFRYPEYGVVTANELRMPVGRTVNLKMHSADVIHSFWIPALGGKRDVNPQPAQRTGESPKFNYIVFTPEKPGIYPGQCAEFCGASHAVMRTRGIVQLEADFLQWVEGMKSGAPLAEQTETQEQRAAAGAVDSLAAAAQTPMTAPVPAVATSLEAQGKQIFTSRVCVACHAVAGTNAAGTLGPNLTRLGSRVDIGAGAVPNSVENLARWIKHPQSMKPGTLMPGTRAGAAGMPATGLSDQEVEAVAAYLFSLK